MIGRTCRASTRMARLYQPTNMMYAPHTYHWRMNHTHPSFFTQQQQRHIFFNWGSNSSTQSKENVEQKKEEESVATTATSAVYDYLSQAKQVTSTAVDTSFQAISQLISSLQNMNIEQMAKDSFLNAQATTDSLKKHETELIEDGMQSEDTKQAYQSILSSMNDLLYNPKHPINDMKVELSGAKYLLSFLPFYSTVEFLLKAAIFQSLDLTMRLLMYSSVITPQQKEQAVKDVSQILIKNTLDPIQAALELLEFALRLGNIDPKYGAQVKVLAQLLPYVLKVIRWLKKIPRPI